MGVQSTELWNNLGLCCFYAGQYDLTLGCFDRALSLADDDNMADVWYNVGQVAVGIGDLGLAYQVMHRGLMNMSVAPLPYLSRCQRHPHMRLSLPPFRHPCRRSKSRCRWTGRTGRA